MVLGDEMAFLTINNQVNKQKWGIRKRYLNGGFCFFSSFTI
jgi:hypothetical protein